MAKSFVMRNGCTFEEPVATRIPKVSTKQMFKSPWDESARRGSLVDFGVRLVFGIGLLLFGPSTKNLLALELFQFLNGHFPIFLTFQVTILLLQLNWKEFVISKIFYGITGNNWKAQNIPALPAKFPL